MPKIGVVLAGAASKGPYEIGCMKAIGDYFGTESIKIVSSASSGSIISEAYAHGKIDKLAEEWANINTKEAGRSFLSYANNDSILDKIYTVLDEERRVPYEHYVSIWNFTKSKVEYVPFHTLSGDRLKDYFSAAISFPFFGKRVVIDGNLMLDGALLDNIPIYPMLNRELDYIFCIYFDNCKYMFESSEFDKKVIKLSDFPNGRRLEVLAYHKDEVREKIEYGYNYTIRTLDKIFSHDTEAEIQQAIIDYEKTEEKTFKSRLTADVVLQNINVFTKSYSKRMSRWKKV